MNTLALMCLGLHPIPPVPQQKPKYYGGGRPEGVTDEYQMSRKAAAAARLERVYAFVLAAGRPITRSEVEVGLNLTEGLAAKNLRLLKQTRRIHGTRKADGQTWLYEVKK